VAISLKFVSDLCGAHGATAKALNNYMVEGAMLPLLFWKRGNDMEKEMLSPTEVEELYGIKVKTLAAWRLQSTGPDYFKLGNLVRYKKSEMDLWVEDRRVKCL
jgi:predicted DNA-binding transcriptional regulator AlpA